MSDVLKSKFTLQSAANFHENHHKLYDRFFPYSTYHMTQYDYTTWQAITSIAGDEAMAAEFGLVAETALDDAWIRAEFAADGGDRRADLARALAARGICARSIGFDTPGLERAFIELVRGAQGESHAGSGGTR